MILNNKNKTDATTIKQSSVFSNSSDNYFQAVQDGYIITNALFQFCVNMQNNLEKLYSAYYTIEQSVKALKEIKKL